MPELPYGAAPVPMTPIGDVRHWQFSVTCRKCRRQVVVQVADIIERLDPKLPIHKAVARLRWSGWTESGTCRARPAAVVLAEIYRYGKSTRLARKIDVTPAFPGLYCERNLVERFVLKIKHFRRIATRYEQTPRTFLSLPSLISAVIWAS